MMNLTAGAFSDFNLAAPLPGSGWGANAADRFQPINGSYEVYTYGGLFIDLFDHVDTNSEKDITFTVKTNEFNFQSYYFENITYATGIQICPKTDKLIADNYQPKNLIIEIEAKNDEDITTIILEIKYKISKPEFKMEDKIILYDNINSISREFLFQSFVSDLSNTDIDYELKLTGIIGATLESGTTINDFHRVGDKWIFLPIDLPTIKQEVILTYEYINDGLIYNGNIIIKKRIQNLSTFEFNGPIYVKIWNDGNIFVDIYSKIIGENFNNLNFDFLTTWSKNDLFNKLFKITKNGNYFSIKNDPVESLVYLNALTSSGITIPEKVTFTNIIKATDSNGEIHSTDIVIEYYPNYYENIPTELNFYYNSNFNCDIDLSGFYPATQYHAAIGISNFDPAYNLQFEHNVGTGQLRLFTNTPNFVLNGNHSITINFTLLTAPDITKTLKINLIQRKSSYIDPMILSDYTLEIGRYTSKAINCYQLVNGLIDYNNIHFELVDGGISSKYYPDQILDIGINSLNSNIIASVRNNEGLFRQYEFILKCKDNKTYTNDSNKDSLGNIIGYRESKITVKVRPNDIESKTLFIPSNFNFYINREENISTTSIYQFFEDSLAYLINPLDYHKVFTTPVFTIDTVESVMPDAYDTMLSIQGALLTGSLKFDINSTISKNYKLVLLFKHPEDPTNTEYKTIINFKFKGINNG